jgi:hypothetical protein
MLVVTQTSTATALPNKPLLKYFYMPRPWLFKVKRDTTYRDALMPTCRKCGSHSEFPFCPFCGTKMPSHFRSVEGVVALFVLLIVLMIVVLIIRFWYLFLIGLAILVCWKYWPNRSSKNSGGSMKGSKVNNEKSEHEPTNSHLKRLCAYCGRGYGEIDNYCPYCGGPYKASDAKSGSFSVPPVVETPQPPLTAPSNLSCINCGARLIGRGIICPNCMAIQPMATVKHLATKHSGVNNNRRVKLSPSSIMDSKLAIALSMILILIAGVTVVSIINVRPPLKTGSIVNTVRTSTRLVVGSSTTESGVSAISTSTEITGASAVVVHVGQPINLTMGSDGIPVEVIYNGTWFAKSLHCDMWRGCDATAVPGYKLFVLQYEVINVGNRSTTLNFTDPFSLGSQWEVQVDKGYIYSGTDLLVGFPPTLQPTAIYSNLIYFQILNYTTPVEARYFNHCYDESTTQCKLTWKVDLHAASIAPIEELQAPPECYDYRGETMPFNVTNSGLIKVTIVAISINGSPTNISPSSLAVGQTATFQLPIPQNAPSAYDIVIVTAKGNAFTFVCT